MLVFGYDFSKNSPFQKRFEAFDLYFDSIGMSFIKLDNDSLFFIKLFHIIKYRKEGVFISMPPFENFWLFLIPGTKIFLDIRDGWSIAQESGYGGIVKKKYFKAKISKVIEGFAIKRSYCAITCTPGLEQYLSKVSKCKLLLIPNGVNEEDLDLINDLKLKQLSQQVNSDRLIFCCAGQFSEYGKDKVKTLLKKIVNRYKDKELKIILIGSNKEANSWVKKYFSQLTSGRGFVEILPRMDKRELFITMLNANFGLTVLRDPSYELGTKVYDYIALGLPIVNYFDQPNNFTNYFDAFLDVPFNTDASKPEIRRNILIDRELTKHFEGNIL